MLVKNLYFTVLRCVKILFVPDVLIKFAGRTVNQSRMLLKGLINKSRFVSLFQRQSATACDKKYTEEREFYSHRARVKRNYTRMYKNYSRQRYRYKKRQCNYRRIGGMQQAMGLVQSAEQC